MIHGDCARFARDSMPRAARTVADTRCRNHIEGQQRGDKGATTRPGSDNNAKKNDNNAATQRPRSASASARQVMQSLSIAALRDGRQRFSQAV